jgi:hypothetical protein
MKIRGLILVPLLSVLSLTGCASFEQHENTAKPIIQYATFKVIEQGKSPEAQAQKADNIRRIATDVRGLVSGDSTLPLLQDAVGKQLVKLNLSPADQFLANALLQAIVEELQAKIGTGVLKPDQLVQVDTVLGWVIEAANFASPPPAVMVGK